MPKNNKPRGGRPSRNFDPRYGEKKSSYRDRHGAAPARGGRDEGRDDRSLPPRAERAGSGRPGSGRGGDERSGAARSGKTLPGSRSPKHRGYREPAEAPSKRRWSDEERTARDEARRIRERGDRRDAHDPQERRTTPRRGDRYDGREASFRGGAGDRYRADDRQDADRRAGGGRRDAPGRDIREDDRRTLRPSSRPDGHRGGQGERHPQHGGHADVVHERLAAQTVTAASTEDATFRSLGLGDNIVATLAELGASAPFPIQAASIPAVLEGRDVLGRGRTGSGKTIAFGAPLVESVLRSQAGKRREFGRNPRALVLAPTRELALQIDRTIQPIARSVGLFTTQIYGGVPQARQVGALKKGVDIVIGTPGRIEDLIDQGKLDLSDIRIAVLDEADHMCELGFIEPVQRILRRTGTAQRLLFSATLDREVTALVNEFLTDPAVFEVAGETQETGTIEHRVLVVDGREKGDILTTLVDRDGPTLVFSRTRAYAETLTEWFGDAGISAVALHGDLSQAVRSRNLGRFTSGKARVLVATDVAARGIHIDDIDLVVQADAPSDYKTYLHRAGRTGRAGKTGRVVTLIPRSRERRMEELLAQAEIRAPFERAHPGDDVVDEIAGGMTLAELTR